MAKPLPKYLRASLSFIRLKSFIKTGTRYAREARMNDQNFTPNHAKHLTSLIEALRPDWDRPGIADAIWKARDKGPAMDVCIAAIKACVLSNRTPGVIPLDGPHWRETVHVPNGRPGTADKASHCSACGLVHTALSPCSPPDERSHGRGATAAREALNAALGKTGGSDD